MRQLIILSKHQYRFAGRFEKLDEAKSETTAPRLKTPALNHNHKCGQSMLLINL